MARRLRFSRGILVFTLSLLCAHLADAQVGPNSFGAGIGFGASHTSAADVSGGKFQPYGRLFLRYYPTPVLGIEASGGMTLLKAESDTKYFANTMEPVDFRLQVQLPVHKYVMPYAFAGFGLLFFDPRDKSDNALPRNAAKQYTKSTTYVPLGAGVQWFFEKSTALEFGGAYNITMSPNLDDIKGPKNDSYWSAGINLFAVFNATDEDSDGDGLLDSEEAQIGTDPHVADTDGDGLNDGAEVRKYRTDPLKADTDGDGLKDGEEVQVYNTNPNNPDTDGDGLTDGQEVMQYHSNPLDKDTDHGSVNDGVEVKRGSNPLDPADDVPPAPPPPKPVVKDTTPPPPANDLSKLKTGASISFPGVIFESGKSALTAGAKKVLDGVAKDLADNPDVEVEVQGHTDNAGSRKMNISLSMNRAFAVKTYLEQKGIAAERLTTKGYGPDRPVADNSTPDGKKQNRRIEFVRTK